MYTYHLVLNAYDLDINSQVTGQHVQTIHSICISTRTITNDIRTFYIVYDASWSKRNIIKTYSLQKQ